MTSLRCYYLFVLLFFLASAQAQDLSANLDSIEIIAPKYLPSSRFAAPADTSGLHLISWLQLPGVSINSIGSSGLSTLSNRGMSSRHTAILYEGVPLNGITTGVFDVSLLPINYFNRSLLYKEGLTSFTGNQAMGGALSLSHQHSEHNELVSSAQYSSTHNLTLQQLWNGASNKVRWTLGWERTHHFNQQRFYKDNEILTSPSFLRIGHNLNGEVNIDLGNDHKFAAKVWWQDFDREIPGPYYLRVNQFQQDKNLRSALTHSWRSTNWQFDSRFVYFDETLNYQSPGVDSRAKTTLINFKTTANFKRLWQLAIALQSENVKANFYTQSKARSSMLLSMTRNWKLQHGWIHLSLAPHLVNNKWMPLHADLRLDYRDFQFIAIRNYNLPGFNDLYWPSGGNPNLKTEKSFQLSAHQLWPTDAAVQIKSSLFSYHITDLIQWVPAGNSIWTPLNRKKVWSRGGEINLDYRPAWLPFPSIINAHYSLTKATHLDDASVASKGKQLIYVPLHKAGLGIKSSFSFLHFNADLIYLGKRYDTTDNFLSLPAAWITGATLGINVNYKKIAMALDYRLDNPIQTQYELVRSYPMPLRYHTFYIQFKFQPK
ncbi:MAG: TonB-dependent receptor [Saprospiraceae bacterium]|nr:TonB-dependent receptor [Saprospiraceae bacterium]MBP9193115.1 TonB-dependent receptor [Saprospiraceae bacterium]